MADAIVSSVVQQLTSLMEQEIREEVRLVVGVKRELKNLKANFEAMKAVLGEAEKRQLKDSQVKLWLEKLKDESYDMEDVLDEWNTARLKMKYERDEINNALASKKMVCCSFFLSPCFGFKQVLLRHDIAQKIKKINENLDDIAKAKVSFRFDVNTSTENSVRVPSTSLIDESKIRGRDEEKNTLKGKLLCDSSGVQIISMVGMGGIGKTTLAQLVFNDNEVKKSFEKTMWVCVSDTFDECRIAKAIIEQLKVSEPDLGEFNSLLKCIEESIAGKKFLLVLDDVWTENYNQWEPFQCCLQNGLCGSKILVATRNDTVAQMMESVDIITIKELSYQECWLLFKRFAFHGRHPSECENLEEIGRKIVEKCKGLPLAAKTIGSLLRFKRSREEWKRILNSEMWKLKEIENYVFAPLLLSYYELPPKIKSCFSYCAVFLKDHIIEKDELINLWMAQSYLEGEGNNEMEIIGEEYFNYLASRSFFQEFQKDDDDNVKACKMHDIVHDFAQFLSKNECVSQIIDGPEESFTCVDKVIHLMLVLRESASLPISIRGARKLRSLLILGQSDPCPLALGNVFDVLTCLRALTITSNYFSDEVNASDEILKGIENLIHLRYLKLSCLRIKELPESCCELYNLQTLDIEDCPQLRSLPQGIGKLVNLRHLKSYVWRLDSMPKEIGRLTDLQTLSHFVVSDGGQCNLEGLKHLNYLRGLLIIRGLGKVTDVDEAKKAELEKKEKLSNLKLWFDKGEEEEMTERMNEIVEVDHEAIIEGLRPNPNIERLVISGYRGKMAFPNWLMSLSNLKFLSLTYCFKCLNMPPLGKLPSLETIYIEEMPTLKTLGAEFLGIGSDCTITFPKLKGLRFRSMDKWKEWDFVILSSGKEDIRIMPHLKSLEILHCPKLKALPHQILQSTALEELKIKDCPILLKCFKEETGEDWFKISHILKI